MFTQDLMESADNERSRLLLEKAEAETKKRKAEAELQRFMDEDDTIIDKFNTDLQEVQVSLETLKVKADAKFSNFSDYPSNRFLSKAPSNKFSFFYLATFSK